MRLTETRSWPFSSSSEMIWRSHLSSQIYQVLNVIALVLDEGGLLEGEEGAGLGANVDDGAPDVVLDDGTAGRRRCG